MNMMTDDFSIPFCVQRLIKHIRSAAIRNLLIPRDAVASSPSSSAAAAAATISPSKAPPIIPQPLLNANLCIVDLPITYLQLLAKPGMSISIARHSHDHYYHLM